MGWVGQWPVPIMAVDTSNFHELAADAVSLLNGQEAILVALVLSNLLHRGVKAEDVGVITFYNGQKGHLAREVERHYCINDSAREVRFHFSEYILRLIFCFISICFPENNDRLGGCFPRS